MNRNRTTVVILALIALVLALAAAGCGDDNSDDAGSADVNSAGLDAAGCKPAEKPEPKELDIPKPSGKLDASKTHTATFKTNCGDFTIELDAENNPKTANSFAHLVENGAYDGTWFHRIITDFMNQGGDPSGTGSGGPEWSVREAPTGAYEIGTVAMAKTGAEPAGTSGSQFFIVTGQQGTTLPPDYAIAGKVVSGQDTIERISQYAAGPTDQSGAATGVALITEATLSSE